jgi:DNA-binding transcriptional LysR family regulator
MDPTMRQLEVFLAVAKAGSFRRAADGLHLSQPALSQHVGELERGLGARFFDRRGRTVTLTEAGRILEDHALRLFATLAGAREAIAELDGVGRGTLVIGASTTPGIYLMPALMGAFERAYPGISVDLRIANSRVIEEQIRANELDLGVVGAHGLRAGEKCLAATLLDELVLIVPPAHPWAGRRRLDPSRLPQERLCCGRKARPRARSRSGRFSARASESAGRSSSVTRKRSSRP